MPAPTAQTLASGEGGPGERENPAVELEEEVTVRCEPLRRGREQAAVGAEAVARREHCAGRLPGQLWPQRRQCNWKVGQVRDHEVELAEKLDTNRGALYKTLHDARRKLRAYLEETQ